MPDPPRWIHAGVRLNLRLSEENDENNRDKDIGLQRRDAQLGIRLAGVAALHFDIATPNFVFQEEMSGAVPWYHDVVDSPIRAKDGYWMIPDWPGPGVEVDEKVIARHPFKPEVMHAGHAVLDDGTIADW